MFRLTQINNRMSNFVPDIENTNSESSKVSSCSNVLTPGHLSQIHTVKRHQEILRDYFQEYRQIKAKLIAQREREDLLGSVSFYL